MPLGAARLNFLAKSITVAPVPAEVIRKKQGIVGNGSIAIDTAQYKFGSSSVLSTGSADSLLFDGSLIPLSGDFTIESWVRFTGTASRKMLYSQYTTGVGRTSMEIGTDEKASFFCASQGSFQEADRILGDSALSVDTWYHIAVVRDGSTFTMYINGVAQADTISHSVNVQDQDFEIFGDDFGTHTDDVWQDEFRVSSIARYTSGFTPSTTPFVNDDDTLLLCHFDGSDGITYFDDDNGVGRSRVPVWGEYGNPEIDTTYSKFGGGSAIFDTSGDSIHAGYKPSNTTWSPFYHMEGPFTIECWYYHRSTPGSTQGILANRSNGYGARAFHMLIRNDNYLQIQWNAYNGTDPILALGAGTVGSTLSTGNWYHIACVYDLTTFKIYINGTQQYTNTPTYSNLELGELSYFTIGSVNNLIYNTAGNIDEVRISSVARYTASFTAPTAPFVNDADTLLLAHFDGTDGSNLFLDDNGDYTTGRSRVGVSALGNAQIDTAQYKFGGSSALFDGTGDYLTFYHDITATDDFVFEGWVRFNALPSSGGYSFLAGNSLGNNRYFAVKNEGGTYRFETGVNGTSGSFYRWWNTSLSTGTWYHWALVKNGTSLNMYQDGSALSITGSSGSMTQDKHLFNGGNGLLGVWSGFNQYFNGWMDEVRISNTARYTSGFTPPTTPFQNDANTELLLHCDGSDGDTDFVDDNGKEST